MRVPFGERGLKVRAAALGGAALFLAFALGGGERLEALLPGAKGMAWLFVAVGAALLFFRVYRSDDEGSVDIWFVHALVPLWLFMPGLAWVLIADEGEAPDWGRWRLFGTEWSGFALYALLLLFVFVYNLLRLNLQRSLRRPR